MSELSLIEPASATLNPEEAVRDLRRCSDLSESGRTLAWAGLRIDHPQATDAELTQLWLNLLAKRREGKWGYYSSVPSARSVES